MSIKALSMKELALQSDNIYESTIVVAKRAKQIVGERALDTLFKREMDSDELVNTTPIPVEEYEELEKPLSISLDQYREGSLEWERKSPKTDEKDVLFH